MKKTTLLFTIALLFSMASAFAQGGTTGPLTWNINNGTLTISGEGAMPDYYWQTPKPWYEYKDNIHTLVIENGVTSIGLNAFIYFSNLTSVSIANTVLSIGKSAFKECKSLPLITFPDGLININQLAFSECSALTSVFISKSVTDIVPDAFSFCYSLTAFEVDSENNYYSSENGILFNKDKTILTRYPSGKSAEYIIPNSVKTIGTSAFSTCPVLTAVTIPNSVTSIGIGAFYSCTNLNSIVIPNSVTSIGANAFQSCKNLPSIVLPNNITSIEELTFYDCTSLTSIAIPNGVVSIGSWAFYKCTNLTSVTIPKSVVSFGSNAFTYCKNLKILTNLNPVPVNIGYNVFDGVNIDKCTLEVPMGSVAEYKEANIWKNFKIKGIDVGIAETDNYPSLRVYPNPTTGVLNLIQETINNEQLTINNIEIFDICGKKIFLSTRSLVHSSTITMDISHLTAGIYFVKISTETGEVVRKIVKQ